jgi:lysophospholipase L1-like esterase
VSKALQHRKTIRILAIGGSRKGGKGSTEGGYQELIEAALERTIPGIDVQMVDRGVSGELAEQAAERLKAEVALVRPDVVLWQVGTHDALMHVPIDQLKQTVGTAVDWLRAHEVDVVLVGLHYLRRLAPDKHYQSVREALRIVAEQKHVLWIKRYDAMQVIDQARRTAGGPSPNEFTQTEHGYECLSEYVVRALVSGTFARSPRPRPGG